jgi:autophagy-related protein 11
MRNARGDEGSILAESEARVGIDQDLVDEMELRHREEVEGMDQRQLELQEEVDRLRANLGEEVLARQTLSAELEERNRLSEERNRDQEEQSDLITALQVDMAQEKDRATDLGIRLQEALLDVDGLRNTEQNLLAQLSDMRDERTKHFQATSDAHAAADELRSQVAGLQAELQASAKQLALAQQERDVALKSQSAEAERLMRDRIAEADGDRAVLEHQNLNLAKEVEDMKIELAEKLTAVRNNATRQADGFKAELAMSKAQLREAQRREAVLSDEMATTKDTATAVAAEKAHQAEVARDAVALATKYYDTCRPLLRILNAAATSKRNGSDEAEKEKEDIEKVKARPASPISATQSTSSMRDSVLIRSLASAQQFDLEAFTEVVNKVVVRIKRYQKAYKHSQSICKNRITFTDFQKGDLVSWHRLVYTTADIRLSSYRLEILLDATGPLSTVSYDQMVIVRANSFSQCSSPLPESRREDAGRSQEPGMDHGSYHQLGRGGCWRGAPDIKVEGGELMNRLLRPIPLDLLPGYDTRFTEPRLLIP